jgi:gliding motility-associated-like protein
MVLAGNTLPATCGNADGEATVSATGGTPGYTYQWNTNPVQNTATATGLAGGTYQVVVTDNNGCADSLTLVVNNLNAPTVAITSSMDVSCNGADDGMAVGQVSGGTAPFTYAWNTVPAQNNPTAIDLGPGTFVLTVTDSAGCTATATVTITQPDSLLGVMSADSVSCFGLEDGSATVSLTGGTLPYNIVWNTAPTQTDTTAALIGAGTYTVQVTDANGCTFTDSIQVGEPLQVTAAFITSPSIPATLDVLNAQMLFTNNSTNATTYLWEFGDGATSPDQNPTYTYTAVGEYCVTLTAMDDNGCTDTAQACFVSVINFEIVIPNTFTPNGDGTNDFFEIVGIGQYPNNRLEVFNRWGNLIYEKDQYNNDWNGTNIKSGEPLPDGGYFYIFYPNQEDEENVAGDVVIFR